MAKDLYLLGCGGHGRVVLDTLLASGAHVKGITDPALKVGEKIFGVAVVGGDEFLERLDAATASLALGVGANPRVATRKGLYERHKARGLSFANVRHPSVVTGAECVFADGSQLMAGVVLQNRVRIGHNVVINTGARIDHDCSIGAHAFVSPGAILTGEVRVGEASFVGAGATILPGVTIGAGAIVGAGAVVRKTVPDGWIVTGNPAKKIGVNT